MLWFCNLGYCLILSYFTWLLSKLIQSYLILVRRHDITSNDVTEVEFEDQQRDDIDDALKIKTIK